MSEQAPAAAPATSRPSTPEAKPERRSTAPTTPSTNEATKAGGRFGRGSAKDLHQPINGGRVLGDHQLHGSVEDANATGAVGAREAPVAPWPVF